MGIWLIYHGVASSNRARYLDWFEQQHIQEKLDRPGYDWAAHYEVINGGSPKHSDHAFVAMFGAKTTRVFYDPSPAQIKPHQDDLTRQMIAYREAPLSLIMTQEWLQSAPSASITTQSISAPLLKLAIFASNADDQTLAAWCAQQHFPLTTKTEGHLASGKYLASSASPRHIVLEQYALVNNTAPDLVRSHQSWLDLEQDLFTEPVLSELRLFKEAA